MITRTIMTMVVADCKTKRFSTCPGTQNTNEEPTPLLLGSRSLGPDSLLRRRLNQFPLLRVPEDHYAVKVGITMSPLVFLCNLEECLPDTVAVLSTHDAVFFFCRSCSNCSSISANFFDIVTKLREPKLKVANWHCIVATPCDSARGAEAEEHMSLA